MIVQATDKVLETLPRETGYSRMFFTRLSLKDSKTKQDRSLKRLGFF